MIGPASVPVPDPSNGWHWVAFLVALVALIALVIWSVLRS